MTDSKTAKLPAIHDKAKNEIRFACGCGAVNHIENPDPFELLSLYQGSMWAVCHECNVQNGLELSEVIEHDR